MYNVTLKNIRVTVFATEAISITYSEIVFIALGIHYAKRMRHIASVVCPAIQYTCIPTLPHERHNLKKILNTKCVFYFL
jgi:hypothetical protein